MKTKDLWIPCSFEDRRPLVIDNFLYIPQHYDRHEEFKLLEWPEIFKNNDPTYVEYCSGNGQWICEKAREFLNVNWIAVEKKFDRARKIWAKANRENLSNVFVVFGDALIFSEKYLKENSIAKAFINFPDPWPKKKHFKNRLIKNDFITAVSKALREDESMVVVTDHKEYSNQIIDTFLAHKNWESYFDRPYYISNITDYGHSFFSDLFNQKGRAIFYMKFENKK